MNTERLLTVPEAQRLRELCNFTEQERQVFDLRVKDRSVVEIAMRLQMSVSTVNRRLRSAKTKIKRIEQMQTPRTG